MLIIKRSATRRSLIEHFPSGEIAFNGYSKFAIWAQKHAEIAETIRGVTKFPGLDDPRDAERWHPKLKPVREILCTSIGQAVAGGSACCAAQDSPAGPGLPNRSRIAVTVADNGFPADTAPSRPVPGRLHLQPERPQHGRLGTAGFGRRPPATSGGAVGFRR